MIADGRLDRLSIGPRRGRPGEQHHKAKLTEADVIEIRTRVAYGEKQVLLAKEYGVSCTQICNVASGKAWSHIKTNRLPKGDE
jgi:hypothetical protein